MRALALLTLALLVGCASAPRMRAPLELPQGKSLEIGAGVAGLLDATVTPGAGLNAWLTAQLTSQLDLVATAAAFSRVNGTAYAGHHLDAGLGLRYRQPILHDTWISFEGVAQYEQRDVDTNNLEPDGLLPHLTLAARGPVAQQFPGAPVYVYAAPTMAISIPLYDRAPVPAFQYYECPLGLMWRPSDGLALYLEGGIWNVLGGGYGALGVAAIF